MILNATSEYTDIIEDMVVKDGIVSLSYYRFRVRLTDGEIGIEKEDKPVVTQVAVA